MLASWWSSGSCALVRRLWHVQCMWNILLSRATKGRSRMDANLALRQFHVYPNILSTASLMDSGLSTLFFTLDQVYLSVTVSKLDILNCHPLIICIRVNLFLNMHSPSFRLHVSRHYSPANSRSQDCTPLVCVWPASVKLANLCHQCLPWSIMSWDTIFLSKRYG